MSESARPTPDRWEHGSEYHFMPPSAPVRRFDGWPDRPWYGGSGRDAMRALLSHGKLTRRWRRLWIPAYYCQEVVAALAASALELRVYDDDPTRPAPELDGLSFDPGDAILVVNYFGLRSAPTYGMGLDIIEDHTHAPFSAWARGSTATFCVASLRKTLPLPDGGMVWSPRGEALPPDAEATVERANASRQKLTAMVLKALYLQGHPVTKDTYRAEQLTGERSIAAGAPSGMPCHTRELLAALPIAEYERARQANTTHLRSLLATEPRVRILAPHSSETVAFSVPIFFASADIMVECRRMLIAENIFPAQLWTLEAPLLPGVSQALRDLASRGLSFHCDARYGRDDVERVAKTLVRCLNRIP